MRERPTPGSVARFPARFLWGAATSAHQVEGNQNNDWTTWEKDGRCVEESGEACDHYNRFEEDIALLADLGLNSYRFSIEWSRIEPTPGGFSDDALDHYSRVLGACQRHGLAAAVSFHHFTNPRWVAERDGWEDPRTPALFARFCEYAARSLGSQIDVVVTINEPNMPPLLGYADAVFPPGKQDPEARLVVTRHFIAAHEAARDVIRNHTDAPIGMAVAMADWHLVPGGENELEQIRSLREDVFLHSARTDDYVGVNTYTRHRVGPDGFMDVENGVELTGMGYEFYPSAVGATIRQAAAVTQRPVIVTEAGIATDDDTRREAFIETAVGEVERCISDGIDVRGFYYWTALDNFEWHHGYRPKFGLIAVDRTTQTRTVKPSGRFFGELVNARRPLEQAPGRDHSPFTGTRPTEV